MTQCRISMLWGFLWALSGCGTQQMLLGTEGSCLVTVHDALALPGQAVPLWIRVQGGDVLQNKPGCVVRLYRDAALYKAAETDDEGMAQFTFTPLTAGDYQFTVALAPVGLSDAPPAPQPLRVCCRAADAGMIVVDLDDTIVAGGFQAVLDDQATPMPHSVQVLQRLAKKSTIIYLTDRPDLFGPRSRSWLQDHEYPAGPVLMPGLAGFLQGNGGYKSAALAELRRRFPRIETGIGDKVSDARAYCDSGMRAVLLLQLSDSYVPEKLLALADALKALPNGVQVVTDWNQIEAVLFGKASYPRSAMDSRLRALARSRAKSAGGKS